MSIITSFLKLVKPERNDYVDVEEHISKNYDRIDTWAKDLVVNDLETGGTDKALSGQMGVELKKEVDKRLEKGTYTGDAQDLKDEIDEKEPKITIKNTAFNKPFGTTSNTVLEGSKLAEILGLTYGGSLNTSSAKTVNYAYYDSTTKKVYKCIKATSINYADATYFEAISNNDLLSKFQNFSYLIESGNNSNGYYRVYNDGYTIQWGFTEKTTSNHTITLPKAYKSTNYFAIGLINSTSSSNNGALLSVQSKTNNSFVIRAVDGSAGAIKGTIGWMTIGY